MKSDKALAAPKLKRARPVGLARRLRAEDRDPIQEALGLRRRFFWLLGAAMIAAPLLTSGFWSRFGLIFAWSAIPLDSEILAASLTAIIGALSIPLALRGRGRLRAWALVFLGLLGLVAFALPMLSRRFGPLALALVIQAFAVAALGAAARGPGGAIWRRVVAALSLLAIPAVAFGLHVFLHALARHNQSRGW